VIPQSLVPDPIPLPELLAMPYCTARAIRAAGGAARALTAEGAQALAFSPTVLVGFRPAVSARERRGRGADDIAAVGRDRPIYDAG